MRRLTTLLLLCVLGCTPAVPGTLPLYPVSGSLKVNGNPREGVIIMLMPANDNAKQKPGMAKTDADGKFKILTNGNRGAAEGSYKVVLNGGDSEGEAVPTNLSPAEQVERTTKMQAEWAKTKGPRPAKAPLPKEWTDPKTSPRTFEVKNASNNELTIEIKI